VGKEWLILHMKIFNRLIEKWKKEGEKQNRMKMDNINYIKIGTIIELISGYLVFKYIWRLF
jgi:hypothetical protein